MSNSSLSPSVLPQTPPPLDNTEGAILIGLLIATGLYAAACMQTFTYFSKYNEDRLGLKLLVGVLWIFDTLHTICISHAVYFYLVRNFGHYLVLNTAVWSIILPVALNCSSGFMVQCFFAYRVWIVSNRNIFLVGLILLLSLLQLGVGLAMTGIGFHIKLFSRLSDYKPVVTTSLGSTAAADLVIAASLCYFLYTRKTGFEKTDTTINILIVYSINNGLLTSIIAIVGFITFLTMPNNLVNFGLNFVLGKLYSNALLATLNARGRLRSRQGLGDVPMNTSQRRTATAIAIETSTVTHLDESDNNKPRFLAGKGDSHAYP